ncbi:hypothetical protein J6590_060419 [Homalodisca vitripennis]|nr:hypothetical protein J6590_060419 [Homalodisca vitripennis]
MLITKLLKGINGINFKQSASSRAEVFRRSIYALSRDGVTVCRGRVQRSHWSGDSGSRCSAAPQPCILGAAIVEAFSLYRGEIHTVEDNQICTIATLARLGRLPTLLLYRGYSAAASV